MNVLLTGGTGYIGSHTAVVLLQSGHRVVLYDNLSNSSDAVQPVKIMDLARRMVELSGLTVKDEQHPEGDIEIAVTGLRPGEKLYEELLIGDNPKPTVHPRIMKAHEEFIPWAEFEAKLTALEMALNVNDVGVIRLMMQQLVAGYIPRDDIVDWVYLEQEAEAQAWGVAG